MAVNLHPDDQIRIKKWIKQIQPHIETGESAYQQTNKSMFDAMPVFWKKLNAEDRQSIIQRFKRHLQKRKVWRKMYGPIKFTSSASRAT